MGYFCLVQRNDHDQISNTKPSNRSTGIEKGNVFCHSLEHTTKDKDDSSNYDGDSAPKPVCARTCEKRPEEAAPGEK